MGSLVELPTLLETLRLRREQGQRVVFANGCFDLLHVGHARYLEAAADEGDILVVGINSDQMVRELKGEGRPILTELERAELVTALSVVDYVVVFRERNVEALLEALRPDVHCKGTDYTEHNVPEREVSDRLGIETRIVGDPKDHSTRDLLASILERFAGQ